MNMDNTEIVPLGESRPDSGITPEVVGVQPVADAGIPDGGGRQITDERRLELAALLIPRLRTLRKRIFAYVGLWAATGLAFVLMACTSIRLGEPFVGAILLAYGGSLVAFSAFRALESRTLAAVVEVGRSALRRNLWLAVNGLVFAAALAAFLVAFVSPGSGRMPSPWIVIPFASLAMLVSASPALEWFFVHRLVRRNRALFDEFTEALRSRYPDVEESTELFTVFETIHLMERLERKGILPPQVVAAVRANLIGIRVAPPPPGAAAASAKPW